MPCTFAESATTNSFVYRQDVLSWARRAGQHWMSSDLRTTPGTAPCRRGRYPDKMRGTSSCWACRRARRQPSRSRQPARRMNGLASIIQSLATEALLGAVKVAREAGAVDAAGAREKRRPCLAQRSRRGRRGGAWIAAQSGWARRGRANRSERRRSRRWRRTRGRRRSHPQVGRIKFEENRLRLSRIPRQDAPPWPSRTSAGSTRPPRARARRLSRWWRRTRRARRRWRARGDQRLSKRGEKRVQDMVNMDAKGARSARSSRPPARRATRRSRPRQAEIERRARSCSTSASARAARVWR